MKLLTVYCISFALFITFFGGSAYSRDYSRDKSAEVVSKGIFRRHGWRCKHCGELNTKTDRLCEHCFYNRFDFEYEDD